MQKKDKKPNMEKLKTQEYRNSFNDIFFGLTLTTTDFSFGLFEESGGNRAEMTIYSQKQD